MSKALRDRLRVGDVYELTNHYMGRPDHSAFGARTVTITEINSAAFYVDGQKIPFPKSGQVGLHDRGRITLLGGGAGQTSDELFLSLVPHALNEINTVAKEAEPKTAVLHPPVVAEDSGVLWNLVMPHGNLIRLRWSEGDTTINAEQESATEEWVPTNLGKYEYGVRDGKLQTAVGRVQAFVDKLNEYLLERDAKKAGVAAEPERDSPARKETPLKSFASAELSRTPLGTKHTTTQLDATMEAVDNWLAQNAPYRNADGSSSVGQPHFMVDIRTKSGSWRCITSSVMHQGEKHYWTIRGEGSSNGSRQTAIAASAIFAARGHYLPGRETDKSTPDQSPTPAEQTPQPPQPPQIEVGPPNDLTGALF